MYFYRFITHNTLHVCTILLKEFEKNTSYTNHCIIKLLHRIAWDNNNPAMLFQASIFRVFQRVLDSRKEEHRVS